MELSINKTWGCEWTLFKGQCNKHKNGETVRKKSELATTIVIKSNANQNDKYLGKKVNLAQKVKQKLVYFYFCFSQFLFVVRFVWTLSSLLLFTQSTNISSPSSLLGQDTHTHKMAGLGAAIIQFIRQHFSAKFMRSVYNVP